MTTVAVIGSLKPDLANRTSSCYSNAEQVARMAVKSSQKHLRRSTINTAGLAIAAVGIAH